MDQEYISKIQDWVILDNKILANKDSLNKIIERKKILEKDVLNYVFNKGHDKIELTTNDGKITFKKKNQPQSFSHKFLKSALENYNIIHPNDKINIDKIYNFVINKIEKTQVCYIKRDIKKQD